MGFSLFEEVILFADVPAGGVLAGGIDVVIAGDTVVVPELSLRRPVAIDRPMVHLPQLPHFVHATVMMIDS